VTSKSSNRERERERNLSRLAKSLKASSGHCHCLP